jgi:hypothetical protein
MNDGKEECGKNWFRHILQYYYGNVNDFGTISLCSTTLKIGMKFTETPDISTEAKW